MVQNMEEAAYQSLKTDKWKYLFCLGLEEMKMARERNFFHIVSRNLFPFSYIQAISWIFSKCIYCYIQIEITSVIIR